MSETRATRKFSKKLVLGNCALAWLVLIVSVPFSQAEALITHVFAFVTMMTAIYTGIGHMDYRKFLDAAGSVTDSRGDSL